MSTVITLLGHLKAPGTPYIYRYLSWHESVRRPFKLSSIRAEKPPSFGILVVCNSSHVHRRQTITRAVCARPIHVTNFSPPPSRSSHTLSISQHIQQISYPKFRRSCLWCDPGQQTSTYLTNFVEARNPINSVLKK